MFNNLYLQTGRFFFKIYLQSLVGDRTGDKWRHEISRRSSLDSIKISLKSLSIEIYQLINKYCNVMKIVGIFFFIVSLTSAQRSETTSERILFKFLIIVEPLTFFQLS